MAVAGGTASSVQLWLEDGRLVEGATMHRPWHLLAQGTDEALWALGFAEGREFYLALQGFALPCLRAVLEPPRLHWRTLAAIVTGIVTGIRFQ